MGKKCIPGVICIENMTLFILVVIVFLILYFYYIYFVKMKGNYSQEKIIIVQQPSNNMNLTPISGRKDPFDDPYYPPLKNDGIVYQPNFRDPRGESINIQTQGVPAGYQQVGFLTRENTNKNSDLILPVMGRRLSNGRDKWQYYAISNTGQIATKLPIFINKKNCTGEYGCNELMDNDTVYVQGYDDTFRISLYENSLHRYLPY